MDGTRDPLLSLQARLAHEFRDPALLREALRHSSRHFEHPEEGPSNQRLEFLGDAVLQLVLTEALFALYPEEREGRLSRRRAYLVQGPFLAGLAREIGLSSCLQLGASEESQGGRERDAAMEDALEALIGAIFLDSDFSTARRVVLGLYGPLAERLADMEGGDNPKGRLQERVQPLHGNSALRYETLSVEGEDHARSYRVAVYLLDRRIGEGHGSSKRQAEAMAAREALALLEGEAPAP